jgi:hypothetical protein
MFNLASSFRVQNKLKERISGLIDAIEGAEFSKSIGTEENTSPCDGKTLEEAVAEVHALMDILQELNAQIEKANAVNRDFLIMLETLKSKIAFYEKIAQKCRRCRKYEFECDEEGERNEPPRSGLNLAHRIIRGAPGKPAGYIASSGLSTPFSLPAARRWVPVSAIPNASDNLSPLSSYTASSAPF